MLEAKGPLYRGRLTSLTARCRGGAGSGRRQRAGRRKDQRRRGRQRPQGEALVEQMKAMIQAKAEQLVRPPSKRRPSRTGVPRAGSWRRWWRRTRTAWPASSSPELSSSSDALEVRSTARECVPCSPTPPCRLGGAGGAGPPGGRRAGRGGDDGHHRARARARQRGRPPAPRAHRGGRCDARSLLVRSPSSTPVTSRRAPASISRSSWSRPRRSTTSNPVPNGSARQTRRRSPTSTTPTDVGEAASQLRPRPDRRRHPVRLPVVAETDPGTPRRLGPRRRLRLRWTRDRLPRRRRDVVHRRRPRPGARQHASRNKRARRWDDMGITPRQIAATLPAIDLIQSEIEAVELDRTFDTIVLHNVSEHLTGLDRVLAHLTSACHPQSQLVLLHHNFYCWNGHKRQPRWPGQLDTSNREHQQHDDWRTHRRRSRPPGRPGPPRQPQPPPARRAAGCGRAALRRHALGRGAVRRRHACAPDARDPRPRAPGGAGHHGAGPRRQQRVLRREPEVLTG